MLFSNHHAGLLVWPNCDVATCCSAAESATDNQYVTEMIATWRVNFTVLSIIVLCSNTVVFLLPSFFRPSDIPSGKKPFLEKLYQTNTNEIYNSYTMHAGWIKGTIIDILSWHYGVVPFTNKLHSLFNDELSSSSCHIYLCCCWLNLQIRFGWS